MVSHNAEDEFIEIFGSFLDTHNMFPSIAGKIYGYLLVCDPPHQSTDELMGRLRITKSSVFSMLRLLLKLKLVEVMSVPGERSLYYKAKERGWENIFLENLQALSAGRILLEEGLLLLEHRDAKLQKRIQELYELYAFFEKEMPPLIERWKMSRMPVE